ncbi:MAG: hypothetical protein A3A97_04830 [Candidatus Terrybacteria bacterium RIFCSPLOWO2_01_FULL_40_23]|uniref:Uncharacterized protein n=1 Tax=Candidatus Terrybacteria bacterium RIFCSPLOWO2_01_FULL_40_23 TaxID=1802366 RepID=A0A1G2PX90_9BACT|nr:MAG: hypothetical protein A3A97_04830 [Candidatus Terrybacteria bacterium RIFCSPLOWO2_01_FULL_40_23]
MMLFLLKRRGLADGEVVGQLVAAETVKSARQLASRELEDGGSAVWLNGNRSSCRMIGTAVSTVKLGVLLVDYQPTRRLFRDGGGGAISIW